MGKIVNALHRMGFDEIYDTTFSADLTIMEESAEFLKRVEKGEKLPLLTSCCPAWVKFITDQYKDYIPNLSTCRSPQGMMSAVIKEYFRDPENAKGKKTVMVSIMPCTAKKAEAIRPNSFTDEKQDTDIVITTTAACHYFNEMIVCFAVLYTFHNGSCIGKTTGHTYIDIHSLVWNCEFFDSLISTDTTLRNLLHGLLGMIRA